MTASSKRELKNLELAFESSDAIIMLEGLVANNEAKEMRQRIVDGEIDFDEAVKEVLRRARAPRN